MTWSTPVHGVRHWNHKTFPEPSDAELFDATTVRILRGDKTGYRLDHLREVLSMDLAFDGDTAQTPDDFPWHIVHRCESDST